VFHQGAPAFHFGNEVPRMAHLSQSVGNIKTLTYTSPKIWLAYYMLIEDQFNFFVQSRVFDLKKKKDIFF